MRTDIDLGEYTELGLMILAIILFQACIVLIPQPYGGYVGLALYIAVIIGATFYAQVAAAPYPYLKLIVRPDNEELHLFIQRDMSYSRKVGDGVYESHVALQTPVKFRDYGKVREVILIHEKSFRDIARFRPGKAVWRGVVVKHPQTEILEVTQAPTASTVIDHGTPIPVFKVVMGSAGGPAPQCASDPDTEALIKELEALRAENAKLMRDVVEYKQRALALEEVNIQKTAETAGLLEAKVGIKEHARELLAGIINATVTLDKALEALGGRGKRISFNAWLAATIIAALMIAYFWANPGAGEALYAWLSNPWNTLVAAAAAVGAVAIAYNYTARRRR